jgi:transcription initiation factor TFIIH subunit 2
MSSDPGDIHETINALIKDKIRVFVVGLSAQVAICADICSRTNGGDESGYNIALHEQHLQTLILDVTTPPATRTAEQSQASLLMMGFPSMTMATGDTINYCACHNKPTRSGYKCTRCDALVCRIPAECPGCGLTLILSTHLARSYHHLFPLRNWVDVPWSRAGASKTCCACQTPFPDPPASKGKGKDREKEKDAAKPAPKGLSESSRYACEVCGNHFCIDCDIYAHEVLHNCPGCQSDTRGQLTNGAAMEIDS